MKRLFNSISFVITVLAVFLLFLSMAVIYISPERIHVFTLMGFLFPGLWIVNAVLFIVHALRGKKIFLIPMLALALTWTQWSNVHQFSGEDAPDNLNHPLKVMTYNTRMFDFYNWSGIPNSSESIFEFIREEDPDILCIQEFFTSHRRTEFHPSLVNSRLNTLGYSHIAYRALNERNAGYGIATFSKYPIINKGSLPFEESKNTTIYTDIKLNGEVIRVFNNHLESIGFKEHDFNIIDSLRLEMNKKQRQGIQQIVSKMSRAFRQRSNQAEVLSTHIENSPYPVLVCGDFNDTPISYVYRKMRGELKDAFRESGSGMGGTYNGRLPSLRIDYIFHDNKFRSYQFNTHRLDYSDHYPISTIIETQPEKSRN
ncbi:MAG: endonuclease/exonuclease/phosphatase family protein [Marinilabiliaceae bacterium]